MTNHSGGLLLLVVESHPVQYRAPLYSLVNKLCPGKIHVVYGSDFSLRGGHDPGFNAPVTWDEDLLAGYPSTVLDKTLTRAPRGWNGVSSRGLASLIIQLRPSALLLTSLNYRFDYVAYLTALLFSIPVWIRCETQDEAFIRSGFKSILRTIYYRLLYLGLQRAFPIGVLNRRHWLKHGLRSTQLSDIPYCTPNRVAHLAFQERSSRRIQLRSQLGISSTHIIVAFFGKLIPKKDPALLFQAASYLSEDLLSRLAFVFVGSGELQAELSEMAHSLYLQHGVISSFPGFVNQSALVDWYLASDIVVLPSRRAGETWGLVVNEALQAGCSVVVSEAVGCAADFGHLERFRTIPVSSPKHLARALSDLAPYPRRFDWAAEGLVNYSIESAANQLASAISDLR